MKQLLILSLALCLGSRTPAQGNSLAKARSNNNSELTEKNNGKGNTDDDGRDRTEHEKKVWEGTYTKSGGGPKAAKNQPANIRVAFVRDYPNATGVYWSKYRGDWTATFRNGIWMSTAIYHADGARRDTRTIVTKEQTPKVILDDIFKRKPDTKVDGVIEIEIPKTIQKVFRIRSIIDGKPQYVYYNSAGSTVVYNY